MDIAQIMVVVVRIANYSILGMCGLLLYFWMKPFLRRKTLLPAASAAYVAATVILTLLPEEVGDTPLKWGSVLITFFLLCIGDRRNYRQKFLLLFIFVFLRWLALGFFVELGYFQREFVSKQKWILESLNALVADFFIWQLIWCAGVLASLFFVLRSVQKVYHYKQEDVTWQEFFMLISPMAAMFLVKPLTSQYYELWDAGILNGTITENIPGNPYRLAFYLFAYFGSVGLIYFYQKIKYQQEEQAQKEILVLQMEENRRSMEKLQGLYSDMRALKHDMGNHIAVIEQAIQAGHTQEAAEYVKTLRGKWNETKPRIATGNPITDIVLSETDRKCRERGIAFQSGFFFPESGGIDVFDLNIVLTNALENALEAEKGIADPRIEISSLRRGGVFVLSVKNVIRDRIPLEEGLPASGKAEKGHGFGLKNIRNVAREYGGDMDILQMQEEGKWWFVLDVMMRCECSQQK